jgi:hypothetical protein
MVYCDVLFTLFANIVRGMELGPDYDFTMARIILNTNCQCLLSLRDLLYCDVLCYLYLFDCNGVQHMLCCVFVLFVFVFCALCYPLL